MLKMSFKIARTGNEIEVNLYVLNSQNGGKFFLKLTASKLTKLLNIFVAQYLGIELQKHGWALIGIGPIKFFSCCENAFILR